ncbi:glycosyltransferase [Saliphagus infecundisoli]|uniref:Glycosyltransferase n=1 Tax=Saliphagus infecundisoli TaxID=1849069 RepID=A0ABD5QH06_9EURY|nr:glycosyltransferase family 2 protein [Saliphagus infecundisoli]
MLFLPGLSVLLGLYAYLFRTSPSVLRDEERTTDPTVEAFIPAHNEAKTIAYAIASLDRQTYRPERLTVVDDGSTDATSEIVDDMRAHVDLEIDLVSHDDPGSKTKRLKEVVRRSSADKMFVLDADTYLVSETYLERLVDAHSLDNVGCSFGIVHPDSDAARSSYTSQELGSLLSAETRAGDAVRKRVADRSWRERLVYLLTHRSVEQYRSVFYGIEQAFFKPSQMRLIGSALFPVGCGVLYDRAKLQEVVDDFETSLGDQLTNSEDIFIGFSFLDRGFRNVQVDGVTMRTTEPSIGRLFRQTYLWGSSYLQSTYYYRLFSRRLRAWTGDVTDGIGQESGTDPASHSSVDPEPNGGANRTSVIGQREMATDEPASPTDESIALSRAKDRPAGRAAGVNQGAARTHPQRMLSAIVASQVVDGLYPVGLLVVGVLTIFGVTSIALPLAIVAIEYAVFGLIALVFARQHFTLVAFLVAIPVRLYQLPAALYIYIRVVGELLTGNRNWSK